MGLTDAYGGRDEELSLHVADVVHREVRGGPQAFDDAEWNCNHKMRGAYLKDLGPDLTHVDRNVNLDRASKFGSLNLTCVSSIFRILTG